MSYKDYCGPSDIGAFDYVEGIVTITKLNGMTPDEFWKESDFECVEADDTHFVLMDSPGIFKTSQKLICENYFSQKKIDEVNTRFFRAFDSTDRYHGFDGHYQYIAAEEIRPLIDRGFGLIIPYELSESVEVELSWECVYFSGLAEPFVIEVGAEREAYDFHPVNLVAKLQLDPMEAIEFTYDWLSCENGGDMPPYYDLMCFRPSVCQEWISEFDTKGDVELEKAKRQLLEVIAAEVDKRRAWFIEPDGQGKFKITFGDRRVAYWDAPDLTAENAKYYWAGCSQEFHFDPVNPSFRMTHEFKEELDLELLYQESVDQEWERLRQQREEEERQREEKERQWEEALVRAGGSAEDIPW